MKRWMAALMIGLASQSVFAESPARISKVVSDEQAAKEARDNRIIAQTLWGENIRACKDRDMPRLFAIMGTVNAQLRAQPTDHLQYRARFVYSGCQSMLLEVGSLNGACLNAAPTVHVLSSADRNWEASAAQCDREISAPDLSYDDAEPSEEQLAQELLNEGRSEEEVEFIMKLRKL